jgi:hypothetical protein
VGIDRRTRVEGFGGENRKPSCGGSVSDNATCGVVDLGSGNMFGMG